MGLERKFNRSAAHRLCLVLYIFSCCFGSGCVYQNDSDQVADTVPGTEINEGPIWDVMPINDAKPDIDTVTVKLETVESSNPIKADTVIKTVVLLPSAPIDYSGAVQKVYLSYIGVREKTGNNDGVEVENFLRATGLGKGNPWCAAFVKFCLARGGIKTPITAWSPTAYNKANVIWEKGKMMKPMRAADVFVLYYPPLGRIGHTGFVNRDRGNGMYESVEGNTDGSGGREGDGVYKKLRYLRATHAVTRWIK